MPALCLRYCLFGLLLPLATFAGPAADQRIDILSDELRQAPQRQDLYLKRALVYSDSGDVDTALEDVARARAVGPPQDVALVQGILLYRVGEFSAARKNFDAYLAHYPNNSVALQYRARLLRDSGDTTAALADYLQLFRIRPEQDPGYYLAAVDLMTDTRQSLILLDTRMATIGPVPQLQRRAITLEKQRGNYAAAVERLATLDEPIRATAAWHVEMAELLALYGRTEDAPAHLAIAREQLAMGRPTRARQALLQKLEALEAAQNPGN